MFVPQVRVLEERTFKRVEPLNTWTLDAFKGVWGGSSRRLRTRSGELPTHIGLASVAGLPGLRPPVLEAEASLDLLELERATFHNPA